MKRPKPERVLFLDIDGVLNSADWVFNIRRPYLQGAGEPAEGESRAAFYRRVAPRLLDPRAIARVNLIVECTGCAVVLSSSWRTGKGFPGARRMLKLRGATFELLDKTPDCAQRAAGGLFFGAERGAEIQEWLDAHRAVRTFAIVDDEQSMGPLSHRLVQTTFERGLEDHHMMQLIGLLTAKTPEKTEETPGRPTT